MLKIFKKLVRFHVGIKPYLCNSNSKRKIEEYIEIKSAKGSMVCSISALYLPQIYLTGRLKVRYKVSKVGRPYSDILHWKGLRRVPFSLCKIRYYRRLYLLFKDLLRYQNWSKFYLVLLYSTYFYHVFITQNRLFGIIKSVENQGVSNN